MRRTRARLSFSNVAFAVCCLAACARPADDDEARSTESRLDENIKTLAVDEEQEASVEIPTAGVRRFDVEGLPPGARFDAATGRFSFVPDFTQSGTYSTLVTARRTDGTTAVRINVTVRDAIAPPLPTIVSESSGEGFKRLVVRQTTDAFLDSPGRAGRTIDAVVVVPTLAAASPEAPVVVALHGFAGKPDENARSTTAFRIEPHDPDNTYWWGYGDWLPGDRPPGGSVKPYTLRRVLHLLDWVLHRFPSADPDRVFAAGASMGASGALALGYVHARHFAGIESFFGQAIARNHRPSRVTQLAALYGAPDSEPSTAWDDLDMTRVLRDSSEARDQFVFTKYGKDDRVIHFGAAVTPSPLTKTSFFGALQAHHAGHFAVWDEGGHGTADPVLGERWWDRGWSRITDPKSFLSRRVAFPAFSRSRADERPIGETPGNGQQPFDVETGFAGDVQIAGDTGWSGSIAGAMNRFLRWDAKATVDAASRLTMPLFAVTSEGEAPPKTGYPAKGDRYDGRMPIVADVTPRRTAAFRPAPNETVRFRFGELTGSVVAAADGSVTVPQLPITNEETVLELERN